MFSFCSHRSSQRRPPRVRLSRRPPFRRPLASACRPARRAPGEIQAGTAHRRIPQPRRGGGRDCGAAGVEREAHARHRPRHPRPPHAASAEGIRGDPGEPAERGAAGRLQRHVDDQPRGGRPASSRSCASSTAIMGFPPSPAGAASSRTRSRRPTKRPSPMAGRSSAGPNGRRRTMRILRSSTELSAPSPPSSVARFGLRRATVARDFSRKPLKRLIPRPGPSRLTRLPGRPAPRGAREGTRRSGRTSNALRPRDRRAPPALATTARAMSRASQLLPGPRIARNSRARNSLRKPLKRLIPRPGKSRRARRRRTPVAPIERGDGRANLRPFDGKTGEGPARHARPEISPQPLEIVESAPGILEAPGDADAARGETRVSAPAEPRPAAPPAAAPADVRPENPPQRPEKIDSAPGNGERSDAAPAAPPEFPVIRMPILTSTGLKFVNARRTPNGMVAC